jgi:hypothetical protein
MLRMFKLDAVCLAPNLAVATRIGLHGGRFRGPPQGALRAGRGLYC